MRSYNDMFRPVFELPAMFAWVFSATSLIVLCPPMWTVFLGVTVFLIWYRWKEAEKLYRFRASRSALRAEKVTPEQAVTLCKKHLHSDGLYIGKGFKWTQSHAETARMISHRDPGEINAIPAWFPKALRTWLQPASFVPLQKNAIGAPWIHGLSPEEEEFSFPLEAVEGHSLIAGTTGAGKTRFLQLLATSIIHNGDTLIIIDPKYDQQLVDFVQAECKRASRRFLLFHPAFPSKSIRLDLMANWHTLTEPASRLGQLVDAGGSFQAFAWKTLFRIFGGMIKDGSMPSIKSAKYYVQNGIEPMLESLLSKHLHSEFGPQWDQDLDSYRPSSRDQAAQIRSERLLMLIGKFRKYELQDETIEALIAMAFHSKEHYSKMI